MESETYNRDTSTWKSCDGRDTLIKDLSTRHLVNILNWIREDSQYHGRSTYSDDLYCFLEGEAQYRILLGFVANKGIPKKLKDGSYIVVNQTIQEKLVEDAKSLFYKFKIRAKIAKDLEKKG